jgi:predicted CXXCH cytochrome family protein
LKNSYKNKIIVLSGVFVILLTVIIAENFTLSTASKGTDVCMSCHEDESLTMERDGKIVPIYVNDDHYKKSVHSGAECIDCHLNYNPDELPHSKSSAKVDCKTCHDDLKGFEKSVHNKIDCYDCHTKHDVKSAKEISKDETANCLNCHKKKNIQQFSSSVHAKNNIGCDGCHKGGHETGKISKNEVSNVCGKCHNDSKAEFKNSVHHTVLNSGNANAPVCTDCHGSHKILTSKINIESEGCLNCHLNDKLFPGDAKGSANFVAKYKTSIHASIEKDGQEAAGCVDCHGDHKVENPGDPKASTRLARQVATCGKCHNEVTERFKKSKHGQELLKGNDKAPVCSDCHGEHDIKSTLMSDDFSKINLTDKCLSCHKDGKLPHKNFMGEEELITGYEKSVHYEALKKGNNDAPTCYNCHGSHEMEIADNPDSKISKKNIANTCGQSDCHVKELDKYSGSIHQKGVMEGNTDAPTCNNCHGNHGIMKKDIDNKLVKSNDLIKLCSNCHASVEMVKRNDLPTNVSESYKESFHGLATRGGLNEAANCESCHGNHDIRPSDDSLSSINKKNLPQTCGKCHPGATEVLISSKIHFTDTTKDSPWTYWIKRFYLLMILVVIGFMLIHNILDYKRKKRLEKTDG